jgi:hypothetical protein
MNDSMTRTGEHTNWMEPASPFELEELRSIYREEVAAGGEHFRRAFDEGRELRLLLRAASAQWTKLPEVVRWMADFRDGWDVARRGPFAVHIQKILLRRKKIFLGLCTLGIKNASSSNVSPKALRVARARHQQRLAYIPKYFILYPNHSTSLNDMPYT